MIKTPNGEGNGSISPDGRWLAYQSNESRNWDIYVRPLADGTGARSIVSTAGGTQPRWSADGRELFYLSSRNEMMHVRVGTGATWSAGAPEVLFDARQFFVGSVIANPYFMYDVAKDGRFLMLKPGPGAKNLDTNANVVVVQNWFEELKRLVPQ